MTPLFSFLDKNPVLTRHTVGSFAHKVNIPVCDLSGSAPGKTLLVTAGMDGDEYASIEAAYAIIEKYKTGNFAGRLIVIPIVNIPGFEAEVSYNPKDGKFPKNIFPGAKKGTLTEQIVFWLSSNYAFIADTWLDLHGGAITESLFPYIEACETGIDSVDIRTKEFCIRSNGTAVILPKSRGHSKENILAKKGCMYAYLESGDRGTRRPEDITRHLDWIDLQMELLGMIEPRSSSPTPRASKTYRHIAYCIAPFTGVYRAYSTPQEVTIGCTLGTYSTYTQTKKTEVKAPKSGIILWRKDTMAMRKGDRLCAIAYQ